MRLVAGVGLRARLALALVAVAVLAVGVATLLSNRGLHPRVHDAALARLDREAGDVARAAASAYADAGGWTAASATTLGHLTMMSGLRVTILDSSGTPVPMTGHMMDSGEVEPGDVTASAPVVVDGMTVGRVVVAPATGTLLTPEEEGLQSSLDRLHLIAGAASVAAALILAFLLAQGLSRPLRRIRDAARLIQRGDLRARVEPGGGPEVRAVGDALNRLAETLEHEEELRKETVADLAHELRTPVTGILSRIEAAQDGVLADEAANLEAMHAEALRLTRLLEDLAKLADAERPGLLVEKRCVELSDVVGDETEKWRVRFVDKGVSLTVDVEPVFVDGDPDRLGQVVSNLLSNALRYTEAGGEVAVRVRSRRGRALLEVEDTGAGIAPDDLPHVFKRFWRGEKSRSRATGGAGIGLAIVRELVRAHDGEIEVESELGTGTRFVVALPARASDADDRAPSQLLRTAARV